jgi:hypothetical protein
VKHEHKKEKKAKSLKNTAKQRKEKAKAQLNRLPKLKTINIKEKLL